VWGEPGRPGSPAPTATVRQSRLRIINVATKKVRRLLKRQLPYQVSSAAWSPDSRQLLVVWRPPAHSSCPTGLWRVPIDGAKPRLVHGC